MNEETMKFKSLFGEFAASDKFKPLTSLDSCVDENMEAVIENILFYKTYVVEHGLKEAYKSWFAGYLSLCVSTQTPFFGKKVLKPGNVVYVYGEGAMIKRFKMLCRGLGIEFPRTLYPYKYRADLSNEDAIQDLKNHIPEGTVLIVFDNYEKYWSSNIEDSIVYPAVKLLQSVTEHATALLIQHQPKNVSKNATGHKNAIGSSRIVNAADSTYELKRKNSIATCTIYHREAEPPKEIRFILKKLSEDSFVLSIPGAFEGLNESQSQNDGCFKKVVARLKASANGETPYTKTHLYKHFLEGHGIEGLSTTVFFNEVAPRLIESGHLTEKEKGKYVFESLPEPSQK